MQNFGVTNKEHYGMLWYFWSGQFKRRLVSFSLNHHFLNYERKGNIASDRVIYSLHNRRLKVIWAQERTDS